MAMQKPLPQAAVEGYAADGAGRDALELPAVAGVGVRVVEADNHQDTGDGDDQAAHDIGELLNFYNVDTGQSGNLRVVANRFNMPPECSLGQDQTDNDIQNDAHDKRDIDAEARNP